MARQDALKPHDIAVVIGLAIMGDDPSMATYNQIGNTLGLSPSTCHESVQRLQRAGLLLPGSRRPNLHELRNFLAHGVRAAFPPAMGRHARGVPTAHSGPSLSQLLDSATTTVWPDPNGASTGPTLTPLYPKAVELPRKAPRIYDALTLVDALRVGQARERNAALSALDELLGVTVG
ncbi:MAG: winged helix-turn-helix domain-containing protein [Gemmatimonadales bacterium]|nr:winged helix-turn-helix domain-containing protein [Gemmatimonadales bacterium]